jgi:Tfp pilus assembly protein PilN
VGVSRQISGVTIEVQELSSLVRSARERSAFDLSPIAYLDLLLAQDDRDMSFDLSPENLRTERDCSKARSLAAHFAIIAGIFLAGLLLRAGLEWHQRSAVVVSLRTALESTSTRVKELEDKAQRVAAVERQVSDRILVSAVFQSLSKNIPPGVRLNDADLKDGILNILGEADGLEAAQALLTALASAEDFRDVRLEGIDKRPSEAAQVVSFRIKLKVQR